MVRKLTEREKKLYKIFQFSKRFPAYGAKKILNVNLPIYQMDMLQRMWWHKYPLYLCSRRTGKTYVIAVGLSERALLYPKTKIGIVAPVYRQSKNVFNEIENIMKSSDFFGSQIIGNPIHGSSEFKIEFKNGSTIIAIPLSDNIRSYGFNIIHIDEYGFREGMNNDVENIIEPMILTKKELKTGKNKEITDIGNQLIISSTANYEGSDLHLKLRHYQEQIEKNDREYDIISYDYRDGLKAGLFEEKMVKKKVKQADSITRKKEYLNIFISGGSDYISYDLIQKKVIDNKEYVDVENNKYKEPETKLELKQPLDKQGNPLDKYALIFDDADQGNDNFCYGVFKIDGNIKRLVKLEALNNAPIQEKVRKIREVLRNFNILFIACDQRHKGVTDNLAEKFYYSDGKVGVPILMEDDEEQLEYVRNRYGRSIDYRNIIKVHNFSGNTNELRARHFLNEIEKDRFKIPAPISQDTKKEIKLHNEFKKVVNEIISIRPKASGKYMQYRSAKSRQRKDRFTVCELGTWMCDEFIKNDFKQEENVYVGGWRSNQ
jgi:hypothetical protein